MLTDTAVKKAVRQAKAYKLTDSGGLYIHVMPTGRKFWRCRYEWQGRERVLTFGEYPAMSLVTARGKRDEARLLLREKKDPAVVKKLQQMEDLKEANETFEVLAREWHQSQKAGWVPHHASDVIESLEFHVFPYIGNMPIRLLEPSAIWEVLQRIQKRPAVETAHRVRQRISAVYCYAMATGRVDRDPAAAMGKVLSPAKRRRFPAMRKLEGAREVLRAAEAIAGSATTKLAHRFLALTVVRPGVVATCPWDELKDLNADHWLWTVPAQRMKLRLHYKEDEARDHPVPISRQALEVIEALKKLTSMSPYVFPNDRWFHRPMSENALGYLLKRAGFQGRHVPHGWRATFSTIMNERRPADTKAIDMMLAHVPKDNVEAAYNRAEHLELRKEIAQEWADLLLDGLPPAAALLSSRRFRNAA